MAVTSNLFQSALDQALQGNVNYPSDSIKMALLTASASPSLSAWVHYSDLTNEVPNGSGYTTGGVALATKTHVQTAANSWPTTWATGAWNAGDIVRPSAGNGFVYVTPNGGTSSGSAPAFPTIVGETVTDSGGVIWSCLGESVTVWSSAAASWTSSTFSAAYGVIYDAQSGTGSTEPLICLINFGATLSPVSGTLTVTPPANGWFLTSPA
jgi:hypothetical protein